MTPIVTATDANRLMADTLDRLAMQPIASRARAPQELRCLICGTALPTPRESGCCGSRCRAEASRRKRENGRGEFRRLVCIRLARVTRELEVLAAEITALRRLVE